MNLKNNTEQKLNLTKDDIKLIAFYLPQFHEIPENNKWWGEGAHLEPDVKYGYSYLNSTKEAILETRI